MSGCLSWPLTMASCLEPSMKDGCTTPSAISMPASSLGTQASGSTRLMAASACFTSCPLGPPPRWPLAAYATKYRLRCKQPMRCMFHLLVYTWNAVLHIEHNSLQKCWDITGGRLTAIGDCHHFNRISV